MPTIAEINNYPPGRTGLNIRSILSKYTGDGGYICKLPNSQSTITQPNIGAIHYRIEDESQLASKLDVIRSYTAQVRQLIESLNWVNRSIDIFLEKWDANFRRQLAIANRGRSDVGILRENNDAIEGENESVEINTVVAVNRSRPPVPLRRRLAGSPPAEEASSRRLVRQDTLTYYTRNPQSRCDGMNVRTSMNDSDPNNIIGIITWERAGDEVVGNPHTGSAATSSADTDSNDDGALPSIVSETWLELDLATMGSRIDFYRELAQEQKVYIKLSGKTRVLGEAEQQGDDEEQDVWLPVENYIYVSPFMNHSTLSEIQVSSGTELTGTVKKNWLELDDESAARLKLNTPAFAEISYSEEYLLPRQHYIARDKAIGVAKLEGGDPPLVVITNFKQEFRGPVEGEVSLQEVADSIQPTIASGISAAAQTLAAIFNPSFEREVATRRDVALSRSRGVSFQGGDRLYVNPDKLELVLPIHYYVQSLANYVVSPRPDSINLPNLPAQLRGGGAGGGRRRKQKGGMSPKLATRFNTMLENAPPLEGGYATILPEGMDENDAKKYMFIHASINADRGYSSDIFYTSPTGEGDNIIRQITDAENRRLLMNYTKARACLNSGAFSGDIQAACKNPEIDRIVTLLQRYNEQKRREPAEKAAARQRETQEAAAAARQRAAAAETARLRAEADAAAARQRAEADAAAAAERQRAAAEAAAAAAAAPPPPPAAEAEAAAAPAPPEAAAAPAPEAVVPAPAPAPPEAAPAPGAEFATLPSLMTKVSFKPFKSLVKGPLFNIPLVKTKPEFENNDPKTKRPYKFPVKLLRVDFDGPTSRVVIRVELQDQTAGAQPFEVGLYDRLTGGYKYYPMPKQLMIPLVLRVDKPVSAPASTVVAGAPAPAPASTVVAAAPAPAPAVVAAAPAPAGSGAAAAVPVVAGAPAPAGSGAAAVPVVAGAPAPAGSGAAAAVPVVAGAPAPAGSGSGAAAAVPVVAGAPAPAGPGAAAAPIVAAAANPAAAAPARAATVVAAAPAPAAAPAAPAAAAPVGSGAGSGVGATAVPAPAPAAAGSRMDELREIIDKYHRNMKRVQDSSNNKTPDEHKAWMSKNQVVLDKIKGNYNKALPEYNALIAPAAAATTAAAPAAPAAAIAPPAAAPAAPAAAIAPPAAAPAAPAAAEPVAAAAPAAAPAPPPAGAAPAIRQLTPRQKDGFQAILNALPPILRGSQDLAEDVQDVMGVVADTPGDELTVDQLGGALFGIHWRINDPNWYSRHPNDIQKDIDLLNNRIIPGAEGDVRIQAEEYRDILIRRAATQPRTLAPAPALAPTLEPVTPPPELALALPPALAERAGAAPPPEPAADAAAAAAAAANYQHLLEYKTPIVRSLFKKINEALNIDIHSDETATTANEIVGKAYSAMLTYESHMKTISDAPSKVVLTEDVIEKLTSYLAEARQLVAEAEAAAPAAAEPVAAAAPAAAAPAAEAAEEEEDAALKKAVTELRQLYNLISNPSTPKIKKNKNIFNEITDKFRNRYTLEFRRKLRQYIAITGGAYSLDILPLLDILNGTPAPAPVAAAPAQRRIRLGDPFFAAPDPLTVNSKNQTSSTWVDAPAEIGVLPRTTRKNRAGGNRSRKNGLRTTYRKRRSNNIKKKKQQ